MNNERLDRIVSIGNELVSVRMIDWVFDPLDTQNGLEDDSNCEFRSVFHYYSQDDGSK